MYIIFFYPPDDDDVECPPESLISKQVMSEICSEAAKLKSMGVFNQVNKIDWYH